GMSIWWMVLVALYALALSALRWMRGESLQAEPIQARMQWWCGVLLLLAVSCMLEWSRLYRFESMLPGHAGGVLGYSLGVTAVRWLGFTGSGLIGILLLVLSLSLVFRF